MHALQVANELAEPALSRASPKWRVVMTFSILTYIWRCVMITLRRAILTHINKEEP